jgi:4-hydroxyphenylpyruvate dioxygenase-like putative hemolysin
VTLGHAGEDRVQVIAPRTAPPVGPEGGTIRFAQIATYGETLHTFVDRSGYKGFRPGYTPRERSSGDVGLLAIDHIVGNVELGAINGRPSTRWRTSWTRPRRRTDKFCLWLLTSLPN